MDVAVDPPAGAALVEENPGVNLEYCALDIKPNIEDLSPFVFPRSPLYEIENQNYYLTIL